MIDIFQGIGRYIILGLLWISTIFLRIQMKLSGKFMAYYEKDDLKILLFSHEVFVYLLQIIFQISFNRNDWKNNQLKPPEMKVVVLNIYQYPKGKQKQKIHKSSFAEYILTITLYVIKFYLSCISVPLCLPAQEATIMSLLYHFISFHLIFRMEIYNKIFNLMEFHYDTGIL